MNVFLVSLIGFVAIILVGFIFYGVLFKSASKGDLKPSLIEMALILIAIYLTALLFNWFFGNFVLVSHAVGLDKGLELGLALAFLFGLPLYIDMGNFKTKNSITWVIILNWMVSFIILGAIAGLLL